MKEGEEALCSTNELFSHKRGGKTKGKRIEGKQISLCRRFRQRAIRKRNQHVKDVIKGGRTPGDRGSGCKAKREKKRECSPQNISV